MVLKSSSQDALIKRLKRIEGQIRGIQRMIQDNRDCESVMTQLVAVRSGIEGVGALFLVNYITSSLQESGASDVETINEIAKSISVWGRVHIGEKSY